MADVKWMDWGSERQKPKSAGRDFVEFEENVVRGDVEKHRVIDYVMVKGVLKSASRFLLEQSDG